MPGGGERALECADDEPAHQGRIAKAHLGLRRVNVHVHHVGREVDEERRHGMATAMEEVGIGRAHGAVQQAVAYRPAVDEEVLMLRARAVEGGERRIAGEPHALALGVDGERVAREVAAHDQREPGEPSNRCVLVRPVAQHGAAVVDQGEADGRMAHGKAVDGVRGMARFGAWRLEELEPCRRGIEEVRHRDGGPLRAGGGRTRGGGAASGFDRPGVVGPGPAAGERQPADGGNGGKRLAAEAEGLDRPKIAVLGEFGGGVAGQRKRQLVAVHAAAVVGDPNEAAAALLQRNLDGARACIDGVLDQLLDHRCRPLDYLSRRDSIDHALRQETNSHGSTSR